MNVRQFIGDQYTSLDLPKEQGITGGTFLVTGSNTGLGFEAAKHLVRLNASKVILGVRTISKGEDAQARIEADGRKGVIEVWQVDMSAKQSVKDFAARVAKLDRLDGACLNAAVATSKFKDVEGIESTLTINVVNTMLLADLLLPKLRDTARKQNKITDLSIVGSEVALSAKAARAHEKKGGDVLAEYGDQAMPDRYPDSKLLLLYSLREFAAKHPVSQTGVAINFVNPGLCKTELARDASWPVWLFLQTMYIFLGRTAEVGARTLVHGLTAGEASHGKYLTNSRVADERVHEGITGPDGQATQKRVWDSVQKRVGV